MNWRLKVLCILIIAAFVGLSIAYTKFYVARKTHGIILFIVPGLNLELLNLSVIDEESGAGSVPRLARASEVALVNGQTESGLTNPPALLSWLSTGKIGLPDAIGLSADGRRADNLVYQAQRSGRQVGVVSTSELDNPLIGAFFSHQADAEHRAGIAKDLFDSTDLRVILGGTPRSFADILAGGGRDLLQEAEKRGFRIVRTGPELDDIPLWGTQLLGIFSKPEPLPQTPAAPATETATAPAENTFPPLDQMVRQAIRVLQANLTANLNGYFLVVHCDLTDPQNRMLRAPDSVSRIRLLNEALATARLYAGKNSSIILYAPYDLTQGVETPPVRLSPAARRRLARTAPLPTEPQPSYPSIPAGFGWAAFYGKPLEGPKGFITPEDLHRIIRGKF